MTFDELVSKVMTRLNRGMPEYAQIGRVGDESGVKTTSLIVATTIAMLGFAVNEATGEIDGTKGFVGSLEKPYIPPTQRNVRYRGQPRRKR